MPGLWWADPYVLEWPRDVSSRETGWEEIGSGEGSPGVFFTEK